MPTWSAILRFHSLIPVLAVLLTALGWSLPSLPTGLVPLCALALGAAVFAAVHHAEVIAHRVGEPLGTLVLALAVTAIETALIMAMMLTAGPDLSVLLRDAIHAAVMLICTGVVGLCLLVGGLAHREQTFRVEGAGAGLAALMVMTTLALVLPVYTTSTPSGTYSLSQLLFVATSSALLWLIYVFVQTVRHRDYFIPAGAADDHELHAPPPSVSAAWTSAALLCGALLAVVGLAKLLSPTLEQLVLAAQAPRAVVGIVIAALVLMPETVAAVRAARANRLQTSMNLAIGSALACVGLTIPVVILFATFWSLPLQLGLPGKDIAMLALTFIVCSVTLGTGRTFVMQGAVHLVLFAAYLFLAFVP